MAAINDGNIISRKKDCSPCKKESAGLTLDEFVSPLYEKISTNTTLDNDTYCSVKTESNISYQTVPAVNNVKTAPAAKNVKTANATSCKRFLCILVTMTIVTLISLVSLAVLFTELTQLQQTSSNQNESVFMHQLEQINKSLTSIQDEITLSREEMENNAAQSKSIDMQMSTLHNQTHQLSNSNTMLQQQLTTLRNHTQQLSDSNMHQHHITATVNHTTQPNTAIHDFTAGTLKKSIWTIFL